MFWPKKRVCICVCAHLCLMLRLIVILAQIVIKDCVAYKSKTVSDSECVSVQCVCCGADKVIVM